jgi:hypothetical protein
MEDASAMDLDWFWRGWFYTTGTNDIGIKEVKKYYVTDKPTERAQNMAKAYGITVDQLPPSLYLVSENSKGFNPKMKDKKAEDYNLLSGYIGYGVMDKPRICFFGNESGTGYDFQQSLALFARSKYGDNSFNYWMLKIHWERNLLFGVEKEKL